MSMYIYIGLGGQHESAQCNVMAYSRFTVISYTFIVHAYLSLSKCYMRVYVYI